MPRALVAVCTLNEADNIVELVERIRRFLPAADVLVIDDNSADGTAPLVAEIGQRDPAVKVVIRRDQKGLGSAIRHGMEYAIEHDYEFFLNLDGDLSHDPEQLPALLERAIASEQVDVVIGSRYVEGGSIVGWPFHRKIMSRLVNGFATTCLRLPVNDCSGSMRCYRVAALRRVGMSNVRVNGYAVLEEILVSLDRQGSKMVEVPITFTDRQRGKSKLTLREALRSSSQMVRMAFGAERQLIASLVGSETERSALMAQVRRGCDGIARSGERLRRWWHRDRCQISCGSAADRDSATHCRTIAASIGTFIVILTPKRGCIRGIDGSDYHLTLDTKGMQGGNRHDFRH